jgi:hypothetical protein
VKKVEIYEGVNPSTTAVNPSGVNLLNTRHRPLNLKPENLAASRTNGANLLRTFDDLGCALCHDLSLAAPKFSGKFLEREAH